MFAAVLSGRNSIGGQPLNTIAPRDAMLSACRLGRTSHGRFDGCFPAAETLQNIALVIKSTPDPNQQQERPDAGQEGCKRAGMGTNIAA
mmetsp:Transcript_33329/g.48702  ORF Transcript_33329/g.48702 Transcript_33329/m.48702 type:complete len:89 (-) Transcript_33329:3-269(-)